MVRRFGKVMSFSGRLGGQSSDYCSNSVIPLSISTKMTSNWTSSYSPREGNTGRPQPKGRAGLAEELVRCRAELSSKENIIMRMKADQESALTSIYRHLLNLELGLRKKEKELALALYQREKVIREQNFVIRVLSKKSGAKKSDIQKICDEARSKIPNVEIKGVGDVATSLLSTVELTSVVESGSENDSDSAIIVDDNRHQSSPEMNGTHSREVKKNSELFRSVSDVAPSEKDPEDCEFQYDETVTGFDQHRFLIRHGSYERFKQRTRQSADTVQSVCTLPRIRTNERTGVHVHQKQDEATNNFSNRGSCISVINCNGVKETKKSVSKTIVMINTDQETLYPGRMRSTTNHRRITKPRDVKNRNKTTKLLHASSGSGASPPVNEKSFVKKSGSVYCALFVDNDESFSCA